MAEVLEDDVEEVLDTEDVVLVLSVDETLEVDIDSVEEVLEDEVDDIIDVLLLDVDDVIDVLLLDVDVTEEILEVDVDSVDGFELVVTTLEELDEVIRLDVEDRALLLLAADNIYISNLLPAPQYSSESPGQMNEQSERVASVEEDARVLPQ